MYKVYRINKGSVSKRGGKKGYSIKDVNKKLAMCMEAVELGPLQRLRTPNGVNTVTEVNAYMSLGSGRSFSA